MNVDEIITKNKLLEEENKKLQDELIQTKEHLKKYTAPASRKLYYKNNKDEHPTYQLLAFCNGGAIYSVSFVTLNEEIDCGEAPRSK